MKNDGPRYGSGNTNAWPAGKEHSPMATSHTSGGSTRSLGTITSTAGGPVAKDVLQAIGLGFMVPEPKVDQHGSDFRYARWAEFRADASQRASTTMKNVAGDIVELKAPRKTREIYDVFLSTREEE